MKPTTWCKHCRCTCIDGVSESEVVMYINSVCLIYFKLFKYFNLLPIKIEELLMQHYEKRMKLFNRFPSTSLLMG